MGLKNSITTSDYLDYKEYARLLKCLHSDKKYTWELYCRLAFCTACRASDVLAFRWLDVLDKNEVIVREKKTGKRRKIKFNASVKQAIHKLWEKLDCPNRAEYIFKNQRSDEHISIQYLNRCLKDIKAKYSLDVGNFSSHTFRKTFGRYVYESHNKSAESLLLLNKILNHSSIQMTKIYIGITQDEIDSIYDSISF